MKFHDLVCQHFKETIVTISDLSADLQVDLSKSETLNEDHVLMFYVYKIIFLKIKYLPDHLKLRSLINRYRIGKWLNDFRRD